MVIVNWIYLRHTLRCFVYLAEYPTSYERLKTKCFIWATIRSSAIYALAYCWICLAKIVGVWSLVCAQIFRIKRDAQFNANTPRNVLCVTYNLQLQAAKGFMVFHYLFNFLCGESFSVTSSSAKIFMIDIERMHVYLCCANTQWCWLLSCCSVYERASSILIILWHSANELPAWNVLM